MAFSEESKSFKMYLLFSLDDELGVNIASNNRYDFFRTMCLLQFNEFCHKPVQSIIPIYFTVTEVGDATVNSMNLPERRDLFLAYNITKGYG